ncbi:unnamed protein product [Caenorhabditis brenneri]
MVLLSEMSDIVLRIVLEYTGFPAIMSLRKVSQGFRNFIDSTVPEIHFASISIALCSRAVQVHWVTQNEVVSIRYRKNERGSLVIAKDKEKLVEGMDYLAASFQDFKMTMKHLKSHFKEFQLFIDRNVDDEINRNFMEELKRILEIQQLKFNYLNIGVRESKDFSMIMPCISSEHLKNLRLFNTNYIGQPLCLEEVSQLKQWKHLDEVSIGKFMITSNLEDFAHFSIMNVRFDTVSAEDMMILKEAAAKNPNFVEFELRYNHFNNLEEVFNLFGRHYIRGYAFGRNRKQWYFKTVKEEKVLQIFLYLSFDPRIFYGLIDRSQVPRTANVLN